MCVTLVPGHSVTWQSLHQGADGEGQGGPGSLQPRQVAAPAPLSRSLVGSQPGHHPSLKTPPREGVPPAFSLAAPRVSRSHVRGGH